MDRMGAFKRLEDVPNHLRFEQFADAYEDRDVWTEFCEEYEYHHGSSENFRRDVDRGGSHWLDHMAERAHHHALATPEDVEAWCVLLVEEKTLRTAFNYWVRIKRFYDWLQWHVEHPHVYDPVLMAAANGGAAERIWQEQLRKGRRAREHDSEAHD